jgi:alpha-1,3-rhamnosyl/mannosyltransferase
MIHVGVDATCWTNDRGYGRFTRSLVTALAARESGFRYTLVFDKPPDFALPEGVAAISAGAGDVGVKTADATRSPFRMLATARLAARSRFDIYFYPAVFSYYPLPARTPCVVCFHDATAERFSRLIFPSRMNAFLWSVKTAMAKVQATRAMTISRSSAEDLEKILNIPKERIDVITEGPDPVFRPRAVDRASVRARFNLPADASVLVYVGGFNRHKNVLALLGAMKSVVRAHPAVRLVIVGDLSGRGFWDNRGELLGMVRADKELAERVLFPGYVPDDGLVDLFNVADALVFPSLWEGFGLPAVEAMACGLPVLASNVSSLPEIVGDGGRYFDPASEASIAGAISAFLSAPRDWPALKSRALAQAAQFTWARAAELAEASFRKAAG